MLTIKNITLKNFLSVGEVTQSVNFEGKDLVLVLGENLDLGGNDNRNGVGKSTLVNAISYAFYGAALTNIKLSNLINKTNGRNMMVTLEFDCDGHSYRIERGRTPNRFALIVDGHSYDPAQEHEANEAQGENRLTQSELERVIGISHTMFKQIVTLNTYSEPFLAMRAGDQREIIEHLLGITKLSEKATVLKEQLKQTRDDIKQEQFRIEAVQQANQRIEENIRSLTVKSTAWEKQHTAEISEITSALTVLENLDIEQELINHQLHAENQATAQQRQSLQRDHRSLSAQQVRLSEQVQTLTEQGSTVQSGCCPTCGHDLESDKHQQLMEQNQQHLLSAQQQLSEVEQALEENLQQQAQLPDTAAEPELFYSTAEEAYNHRSSTEGLKKDLQRLQQQHNPYQEQIADLQNNSVQTIDYELINGLCVRRDHQDFLLKLLTNKDSFIRKKIVDQNLSYLNHRLKHYLDSLGLPHNVVFHSDLTVEITEHGRDLDFDNLSRGERTRLILSLSLSFRDVYESLNSPISLLFIDELIDSGLDSAGVESALRVLKQITRDQRKNIYLISHRDELLGRVDNLLRVVKSGGFTSFDEDSDIMV